MADQQEKDDRRRISTIYPLEPTSYKLLEVIGTGVSATVHKASCLAMNSSVVAIKAIDLERSRANLDDVRREAKAMALLSHPNILKAHCSFTVDHHLWVVMPFMSAGSLHSIISSSFPNGLDESAIAIVLRETLNALCYLHDQGLLHRDIKAGNILVDSDGSVKLADFGVSASIYEPNSSQSSFFSSSNSSNLMFNEVAGTPYWMAPEVIHSHTGYSFKADIWSFGITALELAHGRPPLSHLPPGKSLFMRITNRLKLSDYENKVYKNKFSKNFRDMVSSCLAQDSAKRPTAEKLLKHPFFRSCTRGVDFLVKNMLQRLPTVEERYRKSLECYHSRVQLLSSGESKEANDDDDDEDSPMMGSAREKHRRISGWNFNEKDLELHPVFPMEQRYGRSSSSSTSTSASTDPFHVEMEVRKTDEVIATMKEDDEKEKKKIVEVEKTADPSGMVNAALCLPTLEWFMDSLDSQKKVASDLVNRIRGKEAMGVESVDNDEDQTALVNQQRENELEEMIKQLKFELEKERQKSLALKAELDSKQTDNQETQSLE